MVRGASSRVSNHAAHRVSILRDAAKTPLLRACEEYRPHPEELAKQASRRMDTTHGLAAILRDAAKRPLLRMRSPRRGQGAALRMRSPRRGEGAAPPAIPAEPLRRDEASLTSGRAAHDRLEIVICLDDFDQAIFGRTVAAIGVGMVLLHQRLVFRLDDLKRRIRAKPHHLQRLALGVEYFSGFRLRLVANA